MSSSTTPKQSHKPLTIVVVICILMAVLVALVALVLHGITSSFPTEAEFTSRLEALNLTSNHPVSQKYLWGICLDNCPAITATYMIQPVSLTTERAYITTVVQADGYKLDQGTASQWVSGQKDGYNLSIYMDNSASPSVVSPATVDELQVALSYP